MITPAGVIQADELDYTLHNPVVIAPITIPESITGVTTAPELLAALSLATDVGSDVPLERGYARA